MEFHDGMRLTEAQFSDLLEQILKLTPSLGRVIRDMHVGRGLRPDFIIDNTDTVAVVEVKVITPQTGIRLEAAVEQVRSYEEAVGKRFRYTFSPCT